MNLDVTGLTKIVVINSHNPSALYMQIGELETCMDIFGNQNNNPFKKI